MTHEAATSLFYQYIWPHRAMVLRTAGFLTRDPAAAEDLAQETLVKAFKSIAQFDVTSNAKAWLSAILRNTHIDHLRAKSHPTLSLEQAEIDVADSRTISTLHNPADPMALLEHFSDAFLISALRTLPDEIRWTLLLVDVESMNHSEAAQILNIPEGTVKSRAHRGRQMLREYLTSAKTPVEELP